MRWLFVGEALVLRKEQRILVFFVLKPHWQGLTRFAEARSICLGRSEPRFLLRLRGKILAVHALCRCVGFNVVMNNEVRITFFN